MSEFDDAFAAIEPRGTSRLTLPGVLVPRTAKKEVVLIGMWAKRPSVDAAARKLGKKHAAQLAGPDNEERRKLSDQLLAKVLAKHVLTGWENVSNGDKPIPFSAEKCEEFLLSLQQKRRDIAGAGGLIDTYFSNAEYFVEESISDATALGEG